MNIGKTKQYKERGQLMNIRKSNDNFKDGKSKCFNCNKYGHVAKECWKNKEKETRKYFKCNKEGHIVKNYKEKQLMKKQKIQEELEDEEKDNKKQDFRENLKYAQYKRSSL